jgi:hypothetical protein
MEQEYSKKTALFPVVGNKLTGAGGGTSANISFLLLFLLSVWQVEAMPIAYICLQAELRIQHMPNHIKQD